MTMTIFNDPNYPGRRRRRIVRRVVWLGMGAAYVYLLVTTNGVWL